jgi:FAD/FMN-containing dehydrogenase
VAVYHPVQRAGALALDGTYTGQHGVARHKIGLLEEEFGDVAVDLMRMLKAVWDPLNILNPGKTVTRT